MDRAAILKLAREVEQFLLPNACVVCDRPIPSSTRDALVCSVCVVRLRRVIPGCKRCWSPIPVVGPCRACVEWPEALLTATSAVWMTDESRVMVHHLKYEGLWRVADELARIVRRHCPRPLSGVLVPIPLGTRRLRERGYNQATILARAIGHQWEMPVSEHLLVRTRETRSQTTLTPHDRARNVADAFRSCVSGVGSRMPVILVDDVLTTGATLAEAARAMQQAGWGEIHAVTFARAMPFEVSVGMDDPPRKMRS